MIKLIDIPNEHNQARVVNPDHIVSIKDGSFDGFGAIINLSDGTIIKSKKTFKEFLEYLKQNTGNI